MSNKTVSAKPSKVLTALAGLNIGAFAWLVIGKVSGAIVCGPATLGPGFSCSSIDGNTWLFGVSAAVGVAASALFYWMCSADEEQSPPDLIVD